MLYTELLKQREWQQKCSKILNRDVFRCRDCGNLGFHNGNDSFMVLNSLEEVNKLLSEWRFDGLCFSEFLTSTTKYEFDCFDNVKMTNDESFDNKDLCLLRFRLYRDNSKYYNYLHEFNGYGAILSSCNHDNISLKSFRLYNNITNQKHEVERGWFYYFEFDKPLINMTCVSITGENHYLQYKGFYYGDYTIKVQFENKMIVFNVFSEDLIFDSLNIHHTYYIYGRTPWNYNDEALITLCEKCHQKRHENQKIPIYNEARDFLAYAQTCQKCGGSGYLPEYKHYKHGVCFNCGGEGVIV